MLMFFFFFFFYNAVVNLFAFNYNLCRRNLCPYCIFRSSADKIFFFFGSLSSNLFLVLDICSSIRSTQFSCLLFEEAAREGWWYDMSIVKLVLSHYLFIFYFIHASFFAVINAGVAGCCTGLALSFPGIQCLM
jgi:hypothetical protein